MEKLYCISCRKRISKGAAKFLCPNCGKYEIVRCKNCRETATKYECPDCKFRGPN